MALSAAERRAAWVLTALALSLRFYYSWVCYLNPDEGMNLTAAIAGDWFFYHHPPLLMAWLWASSFVSAHVAWLRLPMTLAGGLTPLVLALWMRRFVSPVTAWGMAALVAVSPNLALLSFQLRGYPLAILFSLGALWLLEEAFDSRRRSILLAHWLCLAAAILAEFASAWALLAAGLYGLWRLGRDAGVRRELGASWVASQLAALAICVWLWIVVIGPVLERRPVTDLGSNYMTGAFPRSGESLWAFAAIGSAKQFAYAAGSSAAGALLLVLFGVGLAMSARRADGRWVYSAALHLAALGAMAHAFPYGRTRHTSIIGVLSLGAAALGIDRLAYRKPAVRWFILAALAVAAVILPTPDGQNIEISRWRRSEMERALPAAIDAIPAGSLLLLDGETFHVLSATLPRDRQALLTPRPRSEGYEFEFQGRRIRTLAFDWKSSQPWHIEKLAAALRSEPQPVWMIDTGFSIGALKEPTAPGAPVMVRKFDRVLHLARAGPAVRR